MTILRGLALLACLMACSAGGEKPNFEGNTSSGDHAGKVQLPFAVDDHYVPSGFMGDAEHSTVLSLSIVNCKLPRPEGAQGECYTFEYRPGSNQGWVGVFWQFGDGNWGEMQGLAIAPGAQRISWFAASSILDQEVRFLAGINDPTLPNEDGFSLIEETRVSNEFAEYSLDLSNVSYGNVVGAFGWVMNAPPAASSVELYLDDIRWE